MYPTTTRYRTKVTTKGQPGPFRDVEWGQVAGRYSPGKVGLSRTWPIRMAYRIFLYLRTEATPLTTEVTFTSAEVNSRKMVTSLSWYCFCTHLFPLMVMTLRTLFPSRRFSSNSTPSLNVIDDSPNVETVRKL